MLLVTIGFYRMPPSTMALCDTAQDALEFVIKEVKDIPAVALESLKVSGFADLVDCYVSIDTISSDFANQLTQEVSV